MCGCFADVACALSQVRQVRQVRAPRVRWREVGRLAASRPEAKPIANGRTVEVDPV
ncbi:hypothetical protein RSPO_m01310 (plasmid) [Ralstonia solanacearum Po82]|uniref:Uncharacterized protein n=1 Tax=Ralstonia solanacearum (strain Po82) TaxID=1031711 RepID=F6G9N2_RALS8|nr:hypothetical protein RSPO_m01310 [Ralstonia solanacearum Po82]